MRRVVITGMGCVTPLGHTLKEFWDGVKNGRSGIKVLENIKNQGLATWIGGRIDNFDPASWGISAMDARRFDKFILYGMAAAHSAWIDAGLDKGGFDPTRAGSVVGSGIGGIQTFMAQHNSYLEKGHRTVSVYFIPMLITNMLSGQIAIRYGLTGPNFSVSSACATSNHSISSAFKLIQSGVADVLFAGGSEAALCDMGVAGFSNMKAISTRNHEPEKASRPFDKNRDGFVMSDGAGIIILEELEHAKKRGAKIYAEIIGVGMSDDAYHMAAPHAEGDGAALAMNFALEDAKISKEDVDYINAHGTSTPAGDIAECKAIKKVFKEHAKKLFVSSTKSMIGHLLGAAGGVELIATVMGMQEDIIHPTINVEEQDPECDLNVVPNKAIEKRINIAMSNSFGFGGHNSVVVVKRFNG